MIAFDPDPDGNGPDNIDSMGSMQCSAANSIYTSASLPIPLMYLNNIKYVRGNTLPNDLKFYDVGVLYYSAFCSDQKIVGDIWVNYEIELISPISNTTIATQYNIYPGGGGGITYGGPQYVRLDRNSSTNLRVFPSENMKLGTYYVTVCTGTSQTERPTTFAGRNSTLTRLFGIGDSSNGCSDTFIVTFTDYINSFVEIQYASDTTLGIYYIVASKF